MKGRTTFVIAHRLSTIRRADAHSAPRFAGRVLVVHGAGAAVTVTLAALAALVLHG